MKQNIILIFLIMNFMALTGQSLAEHQWKDRLILLFSPGLEDADAREQMEKFRSRAAAMQNRDLLLYQISPHSVNAPEGTKNTSSAAWFYKHYRVNKDESRVLLIGKDGGEKLRSEVVIEPKKIFDLIDTMPMRRAEMRRNTDGGK